MQPGVGGIVQTREEEAIRRSQEEILLLAGYQTSKR